MLFNFIALLLLIFGFAVLLVTFLWVARLLALRAQERARAAGPAEAGEPAPPDPLSAATSAEAEAAAVEEARAARVAVSTGANLALILGLLAAGLFWLSPLFLVLSAAGVYYGCRSLWIGVRRYRTLIYRALLGVLLSLASVGFQYLYLTGQLGQMIPLFAVA
ncbi:MAG: hypothetical protein ABIL09_20370 [Gemmatimonadota bacterium]